MFVGRVLAPMLATAGRPPDFSGLWAVEMKWDGMRAISSSSTRGFRLYSRTGRDVSGSYPEIAVELQSTVGGREVILDGEIIAPGPTGAPVFERLQRRMQVTRATPSLISSVPVQYMVFDLLDLDGETVTALPYLKRRTLLQELDLDGRLVRVSPFWLGADLDRMLQLARDNGLEGVMLKRTTSAYTPGRRSPAWRKIPLRRRTDGVIVGWMPGSGSNTATFGSLVLAAHDPTGRLRVIGSVGTGFSYTARRQIRAALDQIRRSTPPVIGPLPRGIEGFVEPVIVVVVEYREFTADGYLRHPSFIGIHSDRSATDTYLPPEAP